MAPQPPLLSVGRDAKTRKGEAAVGVRTGILYLAPSTVANGKTDLCPNASPGCRAACLFTAGQAGRFRNINQARVRKTLEFLGAPDDFLQRLNRDVMRLVASCKRDGLEPAVRLNGTSDLPWHRVKGATGKTLLEMWPGVQFYDYTKDPRRMREARPANYHLVFSRSETNPAEAMALLADGYKVAVVGDGPRPETWRGYKTTNGDLHDARHKDHPGAQVVWLRAKGDAIGDTSGFVVRQ